LTQYKVSACKAAERGEYKTLLSEANAVGWKFSRLHFSCKKELPDTIETEWLLSFS